LQQSVLVSARRQVVALRLHFPSMNSPISTIQYKTTNGTSEHGSNGPLERGCGHPEKKAAAWFGVLAPKTKISFFNLGPVGLAHFLILWPTAPHFFF